MSQSFLPKRPIDPSLGALLAAAGEDMSGYVALIEPCGMCMGDMDHTEEAGQLVYTCVECGHSYSRPT